MNFKGLKKYFTPHNNIPQIIGIVILAIGVILFIGDWMYLGISIAAVGGCIVAFTRDSRPSDSEVDRIVTEKTKDIDSRARSQLGVRERLMGAFEPAVFAGFDFTDRGGLLVAVGKDKKYRTNRYKAAEMLFARDRIHVLTYSFCLTDDEERTSYITERYENIGTASVESSDERFDLYGGENGKTADMRVSVLVITNRSGERICEIPVREGADVDRTVAAINQLAAAKLKAMQVKIIA